jgi:hypothetical protein
MVMMVYLLFMAACTVGAVVTAAAACHMAIARAFAAGVTVGQRTPLPPAPVERPVLRLVE